MRKMAVVGNGHPTVRSVILHETDHGVYLFPCSSLEDGSSMGDYWFETVADADADCLDLYGIAPNDWKYIDDPVTGCLQDWIAPVRVKGVNEGKPQWGTLERLEDDGLWHEIPR